MTPAEKDALDLEYAKASAHTVAFITGLTIYVVREHDGRGYSATTAEHAALADRVGHYSPDGTWTAI